MTNIAIQTTNLTKRYGNFTAVDGVSLSVKEGEIFCFLGVNGAGKTTTIKMLTGILSPTDGEVLICGYNLSDQAEEAKAITGYIPDRPYLYPKLTAVEFLRFIGDLYHIPRAEIKRRTDELLERFSLTNWRNELIESFSHGMKQRLATAAALIIEPRVLIIDEPMVGLDPKGARLLKDIFKEHARKGVSLFLSTHSLDVAEELASRIAIINRGKIIALGTLDELRERAGESGSALEQIFLTLTDAKNDEATIAPDRIN